MTMCMAKCLSSAVLPSTFMGSHVLQSQLRESDRKARVSKRVRKRVQGEKGVGRGK